MSPDEQTNGFLCLKRRYGIRLIVFEWWYIELEQDNARTDDNSSHAFPLFKIASVFSRVSCFHTVWKQWSYSRFSRQQLSSFAISFPVFIVMVNCCVLTSTLYPSGAAYFQYFYLQTRLFSSFHITWTISVLFSQFQERKTALFHAVEKGHVLIVKELLDAGANTETTNKVVICSRHCSGI